ncbi:MAG: LdpA C-terminal domain-containing domain [Synechococcus sp.]|nr:LdpA C-terminal domain-containing domain [Synechococcus sp.]
MPEVLEPEVALTRGHWVKLICGASNQDLASIEDLSGIFALAGVHCIDAAADPAVVAAIRRGFAWAVAQGAALPWLMLSLSDGADPHFRKAWFDPRRCPITCSRPCERVCPALAIGVEATGEPGVLSERCYGCGRCTSVCPEHLIEERGQVLAGDAVAPLLAQLRPDAVELHTQPGRGKAFADRVVQLVASGVHLRRVAVSAGLEGTAQSARQLAAELWQRFDVLRREGMSPLWQLDGRPMSGDVGAGTAAAAVALAAALLPLAPPGPVQLAGGTNAHTHALLAARGPLRRQIAGVAFGGVARRLLQPLLLEAQLRGRPLLADGELWPRALRLAQALVNPWLEQRQ